jgi:hypothetical protein
MARYLLCPGRTASPLFQHGWIPSPVRVVVCTLRQAKLFPKFNLIALARMMRSIRPEIVM